MLPGTSRPRVRIGALILPLVLLAAGCAVPGTAGAPGLPRFVDETTPAPVTAEPLGSVRFGVDAALKAVGVFDARDSEQKLTLTDRAGFTWTLTIPGEALGHERAISMVALTGLQGSGFPGDLVSGVQLEPIGLRFDRPATLSVTGPSLARAVILGGDHDGSDLRFTLADPVDSGAAARITHFSTYVVDDLGAAAATVLRARAVEQERALSRQAEALIADPDIVVPRPPAARLDCPDPLDREASGLALTKFERAFLEPEDELIADLLAAQESRALLGDAASPDRTVLVSLLGRQFLKAHLLMDQYGSDLERLPAIADVVLRAAVESRLLGVADADWAALTTKVTAMYQKALGRLFDRLVNQHQFWAIQTILDAARQLHLVTDANERPVVDRLQEALRFDLQLTFNLTRAPGHHWVVQARLPLAYEVAARRLQGAAVGTVVSYVADEPGVRMVAPDFVVRAAVRDVDPCGGTAELQLDRFYPESETYSGTAGSRTLARVRSGWAGLFAKYATGGGYEFPVSVRGNDPVPIDTSVIGPSGDSGGGAGGTLQIRLTHTPHAG